MNSQTEAIINETIDMSNFLFKKIEENEVATNIAKYVKSIDTALENEGFIKPEARHKILCSIIDSNLFKLYNDS